MDNCVIYDFETLGQHQKHSAVVCMAMITFNESYYTTSDAYTYEELVDKAKFIKFDVEDQVTNYGRKINRETLDWWNDQGKEAKHLIVPSDEDRKISELYSFMKEHTEGMKIRKAYTRGNTFDPMFLQYLMEDTGNKDPFHWRTVRDTRSMIEGMSFGMKLDNDYMPSELQAKFIKHDPRHDVAMDVMRMQYLAQAILGK